MGEHAEGVSGRIYQSLAGQGVIQNPDVQNQLHLILQRISTWGWVVFSVICTDLKEHMEKDLKCSTCVD